MQGSPPVFLNNEANLISRSLDAFGCAVRTCCDQAKTNFEEMAKASGMNMDGQFMMSSGPSPTTAAVMANENELCSRNIVLSAKTLLEQHSALEGGKSKKHGLSMIALAMSAFLENSQNDQGSSGGNNGSGGGFTDEQIKNLLAACDIVIQHPVILHSPGPIYHMASNATILLCHLLNGIYSNCNSAAEKNQQNGLGPPNNKVESILFDEVFDTFMSMRKVLNNHRRNLPVKLRCHGIPRPPNLGPFKNLDIGNNRGAFIDLMDTLMCQCNGCQGFVLMGCSPCVAAERTLKMAQDNEKQEETYQEITNDVVGGINNYNADDTQMDDDQLLDILSRIIQN